MFVLGITLIVAGLLLAYFGGTLLDWMDRREVEARQVAEQYAAAMAAGQSRHPSRLDAA